jgi:hypothetical protein
MEPSTSEAKAYSQSCYKHSGMRGKRREAHEQEPPLTALPQGRGGMNYPAFTLLPHKSRMLWVYKDCVADSLLLPPTSQQSSPSHKLIQSTFPTYQTPPNNHQHEG